MSLGSQPLTREQTLLLFFSCPCFNRCHTVAVDPPYTRLVLCNSVFFRTYSVTFEHGLFLEKDQRELRNVWIGVLGGIPSGELALLEIEAVTWLSLQLFKILELFVFL